MSLIIRCLDQFMQRVANFIYSRITLKSILANLGSCGIDVSIGKDCTFEGKKNISIGNHVFIGQGATFLTTNARIVIGDYIMFGPEVAIVTGDHRFDVIGEYMYNITEKRHIDDQPVIIDDDVWIGMRTTILKGVHIGKGSVIGACSVVTKNVEPYSIYAGVPAKKIGMRFEKDDIYRHEKNLYPK